ncbi:MAG: TatD family hydrolase, partial [Patescibacteria group bacterium]
QFKEKQKQIFLEQLDLARELDLPVIVHCRMAHTDVLNILKSQIPNPKSQKICGVIHCFTGSWEEAQKYLKLGFYLGINGIIFKFDINKTIKNCPLDKILVETDCPYLTPKAEGDKKNEPIFVKHVIQKIAEIKQISFDEVTFATTQNAKTLFKT